MKGNQPLSPSSILKAVSVAVLFTWAQPCESGPGCTARLDQVAGKKLLFMQNSWLKLAFAPEKGGQWTALSAGQGKIRERDFVLNVFDDMDWSRYPHQYQPFSLAQYNCSIVRNTQNEVVAHLWKRGEQEFQFFIVHKILHLRSGECRFRVDYEIENIPEAMVAREFRLNCHNGLYPSEEGTYFFPTTAGIRKMVFNKAAMHQWSKDPPRAWSALVNSKGVGIACVMQFGHLYLLYNWMGRNVATMEWRYLPVTIDAGKSFKTSVWVIPFRGMKDVQHASPEAVYALQCPEEIAGAAGLKGLLRVFPAVDGNLQIVIETRDLEGEEWQEVVSPMRLVVSACQLKDVPFTLGGPVKKSQVLRVRVKVNGQETANFEKFVRVKGTQGKYVYGPVEKKLVRPPEKRYFAYHPSTAYVTPHVPWYRPYAGGKLNALFIQTFATTRDVVEYAQHMSLDYTVPTITDKRLFPSDGSLQMSAVECVKQLDRYLGQNRKYDLIVIGPFDRRYYHGTDLRKKFWGALPKQTHARILELVEGGVGLLVIGKMPAMAIPKMTALHDIYEKLKNGGDDDDFLAGLEEETVPELNIAAARFNARNVVRGMHGKGRVIFLDGTLGEFPAILECMLWCAKKDPLVRVVSFKPERKQLNFKLVLETTRPVDNAEITFSITRNNDRGKTEAQDTVPAKLVRG